jgi:diguanylate cyclase (GGDEF)-like protein
VHDVSPQDAEAGRFRDQFEAAGLQPTFNSKIDRIVLSTGNTAQVFARILRWLSRELGLSAVLLFAWDDKLQRLEAVAQQGVVRAPLRKISALLQARLADSPKRTRTIERGTLQTLFLPPTKGPAKRSLASALLLYPLGRDDKLMGVLALQKGPQGSPPPRLDMLHAATCPLVLLLENKRYSDKMLSLVQAANVDGLTGLFNHRFFQEILGNEILRAQRVEFPVSLLLIDIDHFKHYNDSYGHPKGDIALAAIGAILKEDTRSYDTPARYGGEEFAVVLPYSSQQQATAVAERIRRDVAKYSFPGLISGSRANLTVSIGIASYPTNAKTKADLLDRVDQALYLAKSEGRNRVCSSLVVSRKIIRFAFCPPAFTSSYYRDILAGVHDVIGEFGNIDLLVSAPEAESDSEGFVRICRDLAQQKVDAVGLCSKSLAVSKVITRFNRARIPVFLFNFTQRALPGKVAGYIGYNQRSAGEEIGRYVVRILRRRGNIVLLKGLPEESTRQRVRGLLGYLKKFPGIKLIAAERANWLRGMARAASSELIRRYGRDVDAIVALNDEMALGATEAVAQAGKLGEIFVVGLDGTEDALASIREGRLTATLNTNPREMGRILVRSVLRGLIKHEARRRAIYSPINIVDLGNVNRT